MQLLTSSLSTPSASTTPTMTSATPTPTTTCAANKPTQAIINPSFETDLSGTGTYVQPWVLSSSASVLADGANAYDGTHFAALNGVTTITTSLSQSLTGLSPGASYILQYHYNMEVSSPTAPCKLSVMIGGQVVDTLSSMTVQSAGWMTSTVKYTPAAPSAVLEFDLTCSGSVQSTWGLDAITLVTMGC